MVEYTRRDPAALDRAGDLDAAREATKRWQRERMTTSPLLPGQTLAILDTIADLRLQLEKSRRDHGREVNDLSASFRAQLASLRAERDAAFALLRECKDSYHHALSSRMLREIAALLQRVDENE